LCLLEVAYNSPEGITKKHEAVVFPELNEILGKRLDFLHHDPMKLMLMN
jgi:uncharacterized SAM-dependent methyltransferase